MEEIFKKIKFDSRFDSEYPVISFEADIDYVFYSSVNSNIEYIINLIIYNYTPSIYYVNNDDKLDFKELDCIDKYIIDGKILCRIDFVYFIDLLKKIVNNEIVDTEDKNIGLQDVLFWGKFMFVLDNKLLVYVNMDYGLTFMFIEKDIGLFKEIMDKFILKEGLRWYYNEEGKEIFNMIKSTNNFIEGAIYNYSKPS